MDRTRINFGIIFLIVWLGGTIWFTVVNFSPCIIQRFGSVGTVGVAVVSIMPFEFNIDCGSIETPRIIERLFSWIRSWGFWTIILVTISTIQWGFGDIILCKMATCLMTIKPMKM